MTSLENTESTDRTSDENRDPAEAGHPETTATTTSEVDGGANPDAAQAGEDDTAQPAAGGGVLAPAGAVVGVGLGLSSLTGTGLSDMLRSRTEIIGQIEAASGGGGDQVQAYYGAPWETASLVNGVFALIALLIGGGVFALAARHSGAQPWVKAVALGAALLGAIGLVVAGGMYFDLFGSQPTLPAQPMMPGAG